MRNRNRRLSLVAVVALALAAALGLGAIGLRGSVAFFQTPTELLANRPESRRTVSLGGLVEPGSLRNDDGTFAFTLADDGATIDVLYTGALPDLFREGQCVIAQGALTETGQFEAQRVLAKHDENYQPREIEAAPRLAESCGDNPGPGSP